MPGNTTTTTLTRLAVSQDAAADLVSVCPKLFHLMDLAKLVPAPVIVGKRKRWLVATLQRWLEFGCPDRATFEAMEQPTAEPAKLPEHK